ncbi:glycoside hydrolase family 61 protein [Sodiomyces alcalophilus JCM 7366]|uniref:glycoside hydrolase family 61 protein n=1 Tax=Sodiomyces alcalophilus JCM 7366 TaxID=591952 RepID=UPI0039B49180
MRFTAASALAMASTVSGHALMYGVWVNGVDQGDGQNVYIRSPPNNGPVKDLASPEIVCGPNGANPAPSFVEAAAGDTLSFEWYHNTRDDDIIDGSHLGPIITYIAEYTDSDGTGPIWTKIAEDGWDGTQWAVDKIKANNGLQDFVLPADLAAGQYLIRQEIIAHHESEVSFEENPARGAQFYPSCVQVEVTSGGSSIPDQGFDFNTGYTYADPGIVFNIYSFDGTDYPVPGPEVWTEGNTSPAPEEPEVPEIPSSTVPVVPGPTPAPGEGDEIAPEPIFSTVLPSTTFATVTTAPVEEPSSAPTPPTECRRRRRRRSTKSKKAKKAKRSTEPVFRRVGRPQF